LAFVVIRLGLLAEEAVTPCTRDYVTTNGWLARCEVVVVI
jgi:hypothetical protein